MKGEQVERTDLQRIADEVRRQIAAAGTSQRAVGEKLGWGRGYVSQLLTGVVGLKIKHVLQILELLEVPPGEFFYNLAVEFSGTQPIHLTEDSLTAATDRFKVAVREEIKALRDRARQMRRKAEDEEDDAR